MKVLTTLILIVHILESVRIVTSFASLNKIDHQSLQQICLPYMMFTFSFTVPYDASFITLHLNITYLFLCFLLVHLFSLVNKLK